jgi:hypothetical protein
MWQLRVQNELNHHQIEHSMVKNPYDKFSGRLRPFMRARSKLTEIGEITYYNQRNEEVAQKGLRESSQGSNEDERENDDLSSDLGTKE